ncbi:hypothetical protein Patl1_06472 [Pistacia atlantica]|uniref:Uncharacterized protein n=1 Tax=Pistacia atlantica TaxID=434234 RepID=A0ACC1BNX5_9ROSI|nr:hypothetical protein Patl1_06472 [Pistacia atlantica]
MASQMALSWLALLSLTLLISCINGSLDDRKDYIVYMGDRPKGEFSATSVHTSMLQQVIGSGAEEHLLYSYHRSFNGFVAKLTQEEVQRLKGMEGVVSVFPNGRKQLHTTRSWDFMGFSQSVQRAPTESNIIVGMLDTGIWPESKSFNDEKFGPPPCKMEGHLPIVIQFHFKIIGAKYYRADGSFSPIDFKSPRDSIGHGTHTSSTAAGGLVSNASLFGLGIGTARGGVPAARIAVYKICWADGCPDADILAAFDDAIADGVDIISISVGGAFADDYFDDPIAIGAFHAMKNGILTSNSAGNSGPGYASICSVAPWLLSVAASTIDRKFLTPVKLGNGQVYDGNSINTVDLKGQMLPLIYGGDAPNRTAGADGSESRYCEEGSLNETLDGSKVATYLNSTSEPTAAIFKSIAVKDEMAPSVVSFSSRGPNPITTDILKPDLTAPGVDILASWSLATKVSESPEDNRVSPYNIISGTSMSCPHTSSIAAYVKSFHPTWSPAAIKSALMTTASPMNVEYNSDAEFGYGSGHLNPVKAADPGLIYDAGVLDYVKLLCGQGYNATLLRILTGDNTSCSAANTGAVWDLNYPSFAVSTNSTQSITRVFHRNVTNVGSPVSTYKAAVVTQPGLGIQVQPSVLSFKYVGETKSFVVTVTAEVSKSLNRSSGSLVWDDGVHQVRSPVVAYYLLNLKSKQIYAQITS